MLWAEQIQRKVGAPQLGFGAYRAWTPGGYLSNQPEIELNVYTGELGGKFLASQRKKAHI